MKPSDFTVAAVPRVVGDGFSSAGHSAAKTVPVKELRAELAELLDEVADRREHVIVTRRGRPAAAIVPIDEYEGLEETADILSDPAAVRAIQRGLADLKAGRTATLEDLRADLEKRKRARRR